MKILIVDDDKVDRQYIVRLVRKSYTQVSILEAKNFDQAMQLVSSEKPELILLDYQLPGHTAIDLLKEMQTANLTCAVVVLSQNQDPQIAERCIDEGAQDYVMKEEITPIRLNTTLRHARQRADLHEQLQRSNQQKTLFLRGLSHELATPIESIIGFSRLLASRINNFNFSEREKSALVAIVDNSQHAFKLIEQLKDIDKIERGILNIDKSGFDLRSTLEKHRSTVELMLRETPVNLVIALPEEPVSLVSDENRIIQAVNHLIVNAIRHTREGKITLSLFIKQNAENTTAVISVADTGSGISDDTKEAIFRQWENLGENRDRAGLGTGLYFCAKIMKLLGGEVSFESRLGEGSSFELHIPLIDEKFI